MKLQQPRIENYAAIIFKCMNDYLKENITSVNTANNITIKNIFSLMLGSFINESLKIKRGL